MYSKLFAALIKTSLMSPIVDYKPRTLPLPPTVHSTATTQPTIAKQELKLLSLKHFKLNKDSIKFGEALQFNISPHKNSLKLNIDF